ncbi:MAG TPA: hypothetical protein VGX16_06830 [Solirubrobacteraceae bacterium]|jgi:enoyl-CoA hydratase/carnithine racemase|nr:hypothetical protein [Solirubrobacteraceae bacterium]
MSKIRVKVDGPLTVLTIDNPPLNLFDGELIDELAAAIQALATEDLKGAVRSFLERGPGHATYEGR